jgi:hypothetical protein
MKKEDREKINTIEIITNLELEEIGKRESSNKLEDILFLRHYRIHTFLREYKIFKKVPFIQKFINIFLGSRVERLIPDILDYVIDYYGTTIYYNDTVYDSNVLTIPDTLKILRNKGFNDLVDSIIAKSPVVDILNKTGIGIEKEDQRIGLSNEKFWDFLFNIASKNYPNIKKFEIPRDEFRKKYQVNRIV